MSGASSIILIVVMIIAFYFLIMRPQRKRQQQQMQMMNAIEPGARVVTTTGIYATVVAVGDKQIVLETAPGNRVTMLKQAVGRVVRDEEEDASLAAYRAGGAVTPAPDGSEQAEPDQADAPGTASGLAGGAPIQEYAPGSGPDFAAPGETDAPRSEEHETAPWPPYGSSEGSVLGESALGGHDEPDDQTGDRNRHQQDQQDADTEHNPKRDDSDR